LFRPQCWRDPDLFVYVEYANPALLEHLGLTLDQFVARARTLDTAASGLSDIDAKSHVSFDEMVDRQLRLRAEAAAHTDGDLSVYLRKRTYS
jgi:hypothetical protein